MNEQEEAIAEEFWLALARNDREGARAVADRLDLPQVESSAFSFEEVEGEGGQEPRPVPPAGLGGETAGREEGREGSCNFGNALQVRGGPSF
jgi:hypothetical protein